MEVLGKQPKPAIHNTGIIATTPDSRIAFQEGMVVVRLSVRQQRMGSTDKVQ